MATDTVGNATANGGNGGVLELRLLNVDLTGNIAVDGGPSSPGYSHTANGNAGSVIINGALSIVAGVSALGGNGDSLSPGAKGTIIVIGVTSQGTLSGGYVAYGGCHFPNGTYGVNADYDYNMGGNSLYD